MSLDVELLTHVTIDSRVATGEGRGEGERARERRGQEDEEERSSI